jgi:hypothetical protein
VRQMREGFQQEALACMDLVTRCLPLDSAADQMAVQFLKARLPPIPAAPANAAGGWVGGWVGG